MVKERILLRKRGVKFYPLYPDEHLIPDSDNARDLGSTAREFRNLYLDGIGRIDQLNAQGAAHYISGVSAIKEARVADEIRIVHSGGAFTTSGGGSIYVAPGNPPILFIYASGNADYAWASKTLGVG